MKGIIRFSKLHIHHALVTYGMWRVQVYSGRTITLSIPLQTETLSERANILHDDTNGVVWYYTTNSGILPPRFFSPQWWKWCLFTILIIWGKGIFHNLNLKTNLLTSIYPTNIQTECNLLLIFSVFLVGNFRNNKHPQKQENLNNSKFLR